MVKVIQYRYYGDRNSKNYLPSTITKKEDLGSQNLFQDLKGEVIKLGIQAPPETRFYLNCESSSGHVLTVGYTGIYELDVEGLTTLTYLLFDPNSIEVAAGNGLIIDIIYKTVGGS